jgi:hypothetical protein
MIDGGVAHEEKAGIVWMGLGVVDVALGIRLRWETDAKRHTQPGDITSFTPKASSFRSKMMIITHNRHRGAVSRDLESLRNCDGQDTKEQFAHNKANPSHPTMASMNTITLSLEVLIEGD